MGRGYDLPTTREWSDAGALNPDDIELESVSAMSDELAHRLKALCWQRGEHFDPTLSAEEAEARVAELSARS